ncbi:Serine-threonine/tyrosine-protein kinase catalytic domain [Trinorchestia longiramus]|nr:Serine-threonine/tyrosine-protein kinase catalytic domain [Trinorchestia longiramus]
MDRRFILDILVAATLLNVFCCSGIGALYIARCSKALGMADGSIQDHHLSSSSSYDSVVHAKYARAHVEVGGGAWCPRAMVFDEGLDYLEVDLVTNHVITKVEVQGRFGNGQGREYAEKYKLQYWRSSVQHWVTYRDGQGKEFLEGNTNTYLTKASHLKPPVVASKIRFVPYSDHPRTVCMRVEIYGCKYTDGLVSYSMEDGEMRGSDDGLRDMTYDGVRRGDRLSGGLGQLSDGETGHTNYRVDALGREKGYEWVGWRNLTRGHRPVEITFDFDTLRNFSAVHINANNFFSRDVQVFSEAKFYFSIGGKYFSKSVAYETEPDRIFENSRNVTILLENMAAKRIKMILFFSQAWIMISEVTFDSVECNCDIPAEDGPVPLDSDITVYSPAVVPADDSPASWLVGCLVTLGILCCLVPIVLVTLYYKEKILHNDKTAPPFVKNAKRKVALNMNDLHFNMPNRTGSAPRSKCRFYGDTHQDDESSAMYQEPYKGPVNNPGYYTLAPGSSSSDKAMQPMLGARDSSDYAIPTMSTSHPPSLLDIYKIPPPVPATKPPTSLMDMSSDPEMKEPKKEAASPFGVDIRGMVGSSLFAMPESVTLRSELPVLEIKRSDFKLLDLLGESAFGMVHLCALEQTAPQDGIEIEKNKCLHIVKTLKHTVSEVNKEEFKNEIRILSNISNPNIASLVGIAPCDPLSAIFEYSEYGDLYQFLRFHDYNNEAVNHNTLNSTLIENRPTLSYGALLYISCQVASGMKYLESRNLVHRDLSARNCLVGKQLRIKISDFAVTRSLYASDYWNIEDRLLLPIRWMPPESILHARFSTKSDVWSFGVTLWEILTYASERPLDDLSDSAVVEHICRSCKTQDPLPLLPQPEQTCKEVYQMMTSCWRPAERQRPPFWEILMFLQRKNLGYVLDYQE